MPLAEAAGIELAILTGRDKGKPRAALLERLQAGKIHILVGTHALIQEDVAFHDLAMAVIDEQHRFGVYQRLSLAGKAKGPVDVLVMTATPIPRTLSLTVYGDMEVSRIREADLIFGSFVDRHAAGLSQTEIDWFEALFEAPEQDALNWVLGRARPPARFDTPLMGRLKKLDFISEKP